MLNSRESWGYGDEYARRLITGSESLKSHVPPSYYDNVRMAIWIHGEEVDVLTGEEAKEKSAEYVLYSSG